MYIRIPICIESSQRLCEHEYYHELNQLTQTVDYNSRGQL